MNRRILILATLSAVIIFILIFSLIKNLKGTDTKTAKGQSAQGLFDLAKEQEAKGEFLKAQETYQNLINSYPNFTKIQEATQGLENLNIKIITSRVVNAQTTTYEVKPNDNLTKIAKQFNTTVDLIKVSNSLQSDNIKPGMRLRLWTAKFSCLVDKSQNILILKSDDKIIKTYNVSTGENNSTPVGVFHIVNKLLNPVWYKAGAVVPAGSSENILGSRWLGFELAGYGIHGTNDPATLGKQITAGCVRMSNSDVEELYALLPVGTEVTIAD